MSQKRASNFKKKGSSGWNPAEIFAAWQYENNVLDSVGSNHGTLTDGTYEDAIVGKGINLGNSTASKITVGNGLNFGDGVSDKSVSISSWIKRTDASGNLAVLIKRTNNADKCWNFMTSGATLYWSFYDSAGRAKEVKHPITFVVGQWYHVVGTYDELTDIMKIYVDKVCVGVYSTTAGYTTMRVNTAPVKISALVTSTWSGHLALDETFVFNKALSQAEINFIYDEQLAGNNILT